METETLDRFKETDKILFSCEYQNTREGTQFVPVHVLGYIMQGSLEIYADGKTRTITKGCVAVTKANQLGKFVKFPEADGGPFKAISIFLDPQLLQNFSLEYN